LWAFNPFDKSKKLHKTGKILLKSLSGRDDQVKIIYIASNSEVNLATAFDIPLKERYIDYPKKIIKKELLKMGLKKYEIVIISYMGLSLSYTVNLLSQFAQKSKVDLVLLASNGKTFLPRLVFGSFAETFIHVSTVDILVYHQETKVEFNSPLNILYAHDYSDKGNDGFLRVIKYVKKWNSTLTLVHVVRPEFNMINSSDKRIIAYRKDILDQSRKIEKTLSDQEINARIYLETNSDEISSVILKVAKKIKADVIGLTAFSGKMRALLGGSVTRKILRESNLPILIIKV
jgi:nucleotide-binding universal stress UspA family protein